MRKSSHNRSLQVMLIAHALVGLAGLGLVVFGTMRAPSQVGLACLMLGGLALIAVGIVLPTAFALRNFVQGDGGNMPSRSMVGSTEQLLAQIYENSMLSDNAKRVLFRDRELELLRRAIEDDISHGDYSSGLTLCDEMANLFGHREEAEAFRLRIHQANHAAYEAKVHEALAHLDQVLSMRDWARAHRDAASIRRLYPTHHLVQELDQRILRARDDHKRELESRFVEASQRDDFNTAMALLKELDRYLTREEASRLADTAENVVIKHRDNLSMQFKLAVNDHRWAEAAAIGNQIISEYPNTKMADEVRSMIEVLRTRANQAAMAEQV